MQHSRTCQFYSTPVSICGEPAEYCTLLSKELDSPSEVGHDLCANHLKDYTIGKLKRYGVVETLTITGNIGGKA